MTREEWKRQHRWDIAKRVGAVLLLLLILGVVLGVLHAAGYAEPEEPDVKAFSARAIAALEYDRVLDKTGSVDAAEMAYQLTYEEVMAGD